MSLQHLNSDNFDEMTGGEKPVLVDFFATWCGPCKMLTPIVEELGEELSSEIEVCKLDIDEASEIANRCGIVAVPTLMLFRNGETLGKIVGYREKGELLDWIRETV